MSFLAFAWLSSFFYSFVIVLTKLTSKYTIKNQLLFNFMYAACILFWTIPVALFNHAGLPSNWTYILLTAGCYAVSGILYVTAIYRLDVSIISPLYNFQTAFAVILAALLLHQDLTPWQYILIVIIFLAGLFTSMNEKLQIRSFFTFSVFTAIGATFFLALGSVFTHNALAENTYWTVTLWIPIIMQLILFLTIPFFKNDVKKVTLKPIGALLLVGVCDMLAVIASNKAYSVNVALSAVIISLPLSLLLVIVLSVFYPKLLEKHSTKVYAIRVIAALIMVAAAVKLSLG